MPARRLGEPCEPRLDLVEAPGLRLELLQVAAQLDARLSQTRDGLLQVGERRSERRVELGRALERMRRVARERERACALLGVDPVGSRRCGLDQAVEVPEAVALGAQASSSPTARASSSTSSTSRRSASISRSRSPRRCGDVLERSSGSDLRGVARRHARAELAGVRRAIEQVELHRGTREPARLVLRDDLEQAAAERLEIGARAGAAEDERP